MMSNAAALYARIENDQELSKGLFRQALQNPSGALDSIMTYGSIAIGLDGGISACTLASFCAPLVFSS